MEDFRECTCLHIPDRRLFDFLVRYDRSSAGALWHPGENLITSFVRRNYSVLNGPARLLGILHFLDSVGGGLFLSGAAVYFVLVARIPAFEVGIGMSLAGLTGFASSVLMGMAADRLGARRLLFWSTLAMAAAYCVYPAVGSFPVFLVVVALIGALEWGSGPLFHVLIMELVSDNDRVTARAALRSLFNIGSAVGSLLAAACIEAGGLAVQILPLGNALSFLITALLVLRLPVGNNVPAGTAGIARFHVLKDKAFLGVIGVSSLLALHSAVLFVGIPLWLINGTDLTPSMVPLVFVVNTVLVVLFQVRAARGSETLGGAVRAARYAGLVSAAACLVMAAGGEWLAGAAALMAVLTVTLGELWQSSSAFGLSFGLAPEAARGEYLGAFHVHMVIQATLGPAIVSLLVVGHGAIGWLVIGALFLVGAAAIGPVVGLACRVRRR